MGYTLNPESIARVKSYLDQMVASDEDIEWHSDNAQLAYALRNGINAAIRFNIGEYARLKSKYVLRQRSGKVVAELRDRLPGIMRAINELKMTIKEIETETAIVGAMIENSARMEVYFPDAILSDEQLKDLYAFTSTSGYSIINHKEEGVTVTKKDVGDIAWGPDAKE